MRCCREIVRRVILASFGLIAAVLHAERTEAQQSTDDARANAVVATVAPLGLYFPILPGDYPHFKQSKPPLVTAGEIAYRRRVAPLLRLFAPTRKRVDFGVRIAAGVLIADFVLNDWSTHGNPPPPRVLYVGGFFGVAPGVSIRVTPLILVPVDLEGGVGVASKPSFLLVPTEKLSSGIEVRF